MQQSQVKATACELVYQTDAPLSRQSTDDVTRRVNDSCLGERPLSRSTVWRILDSAAIRPWQHRCWIFPRDKNFADKAARILDLYEGFWEGQRLGPRDFVISSDEKTSIQARRRCHQSLPPAPHIPMRVEHEYQRGGALQYLAARDVFRGLVFGRTEDKTGIAPFGRLVDQVMQQEPYCNADRVFWIVDNGSSHRGQTSVDRMGKCYPNAILVHTPVHASWLNQIEIYFSIIQRKVLTPNNFRCLDEVRRRLADFAKLYNKNPSPFGWSFNRQKLNEFISRLNRRLALNQEPQLEFAT